MAVADQVRLGAEAAPRTAQRMVFRLRRLAPPPGRPAAARGPGFFSAPAAEAWARLMVASTHHNSRSMTPARSSRSSRASRILAQVPSLRQRLKRS